MTQSNFLLPPITADSEKRRALAKVYSLLIRLAEEAEKNTALEEKVNTDEGKTASLESSTKDVSAI